MNWQDAIALDVDVSLNRMVKEKGRKKELTNS